MSDHIPTEPSDPARPASAGAPTGENWERAALERIALAAINEQRAARRWRIFFRFVFLAILAVAVWRAFDFTGDKVSKTARHTALDSAFEDDATAAVILRCNSPGGSPVQAGIINREITRLRTKYPSKPLYVVVNDMCASGGYYAAAAADKIYVDKASIVGSIGVLMDGFGFTGLMSKLGVERRLHTSGANKGAFDPFSPETPGMDAHAQEMLDQIHAQFIDAVKKGRGARLKDNPDLFSGMFWTGQKSVELGLADGFGDADYVAREIVKQPDLIDYTQKESIGERVARKFGAAVGNASMNALMVGGKMQLK